MPSTCFKAFAEKRKRLAYQVIATDMAEYRVSWQPTKATGYDFVGLGLPSFRRANITVRQEVGGSSIEASKIAGHASAKVTESTRVPVEGQEERRRRSGARASKKVVEIKAKDVAE